MEPYKLPMYKGKWSSKHPWLCSMLIFRGVISMGIHGMGDNIPTTWLPRAGPHSHGGSNRGTPLLYHMHSSPLTMRQRLLQSPGPVPWICRAGPGRYHGDLREFLDLEHLQSKENEGMGSDVPSFFGVDLPKSTMHFLLGCFCSGCFLHILENELP